MYTLQLLAAIGRFHPAWWWP